MVTIQHDLAVGNIGHRKDSDLIGVIVNGFVRSAFKLHANLQFSRQRFARFNLDQIGIIFAKGIFWLNLYRHLIASDLTVQCFFDLGQGIAEAAVQIHHRLAAFLDKGVLDI